MAFSDFIKHYDSTWNELMQEQHKLHIEGDSEQTIWTTWKMSYEQVVKKSQDAAYILKLWALLYSGDLWYELMAFALQLPKLGIKAPSWLLRVVENRLKFSSALVILSRYSLVDLKEETSSHSMHKVLHKWCYSLSTSSERAELARIAISIVALSVPSGSDPQYRVLQRLQPHGIQIYRWTVNNRPTYEAQISDSHQGWIFSQLGSLFLHGSQDKLDQAQEMYHQALHRYEKALGAEHTSTLDVVNCLGVVYLNQGELGNAEKMYQRALEGFEKKALSAKHTLTPEKHSALRLLNNLGTLYWRQSKLDDAEKMYQRALKGFEKEKALSAENTSALDTLGILDIVANLGNLYGAQRKLEEAEKMIQQALQGYEKALGVDHIVTLNTVQNLGRLYKKQGKLDKAEEMYQRALQGMKTELGTEHTSTLIIVNDLGRLYKIQGKLGEAEEMHQRALQGYKKAVGLEHVSTLCTVNHLGCLYEIQGKLGEAEKMYQQALQGFKKALGAEHKLTLKANNNLGRLCETRAS